MQVPTEDDWRSEPWSLDSKWAYENFRGKTIAEAIALFEDNSLIYSEDLMHMPSRVFGYYLRGYIAYLMSDAARGDSDAASSFISLIEFKAEHQPEDLAPLWNEIEPLLHKLAHQQDDFDACWEIYGDFRARIHGIVKRGFAVSFDTSEPERVPPRITLADMAGTLRTMPIDVAAPIFANSGLPTFTSQSTRDDVIAALGNPQSAGGGMHPQFGFIPYWIVYDLNDCRLRFEFKDQFACTVTFEPPSTDEQKC